MVPVRLGVCCRAPARWLILIVAALLWVPGCGGAAPARDAPAKAKGAADGAAAMLIRDDAHLAQLQFMRQALSEMTLEEAKKKEGIAALAEAEDALKAIIADADRDPKSVESLRPKVQQVHTEAETRLRAALPDAQLRQLGQRAQQMGMQGALLASPADELVATLSNFKLTEQQAGQIKKFAAEEAAEVRKLSTADTARQLQANLDRLGPAVLAARAKLKTALTAEQFKQFDTGFSMDRPDNAAEAADSAGRPDRTGNPGRPASQDRPARSR